MNAIYSLLRHVITAIAALSAYLALYEPPPPAADSLPVDPLGALGMTLAVGLTRWALAMVGRILAYLADKASGGMSGGSWCLLVWCSMAVGLIGALPSCSAAQRERLGTVPLRACVATDQGTLCYSNKEGATATVNLRGMK